MRFIIKRAVRPLPSKKGWIKTNRWCKRAANSTAWSFLWWVRNQWIRFCICRGTSMASGGVWSEPPIKTLLSRYRPAHASSVSAVVRHERRGDPKIRRFQPLHFFDRSKGENCQSLAECQSRRPRHRSVGEHLIPFSFTSFLVSFEGLLGREPDLAFFVGFEFPLSDQKI